MTFDDWEAPRKWEPHDGQKKAVRFLLEHACAALLASPGTGKTSIVYATLKILRAKGLFRRALVLAPLRPAQLVWPAERDKWQDFSGLTVAVLRGKDRDAVLRDKSVDICVTNYESLDWLVAAEKTRTPSGKLRVAANTNRFEELGFDTLIIDELSKFKATDTGRFKTLKAVHHLFARRWGLTGSPAANGLMGLFGQCLILDQGRTFGPYITHFRAKYFTPDRNGYDWHLKEGAEQEIYTAMAPLALRLDAADYVGMPEVIENVIRLDLPEAVRATYDALHDDLIARIGDKVVTAANAAAASTKCRQVASGGLYLETKPGEPRRWENLHTTKIDALCDLIDELQGSPLLVAYDFEHDLDRIRKRLGKDVPYIGGGVSDKRAQELEKAWNAGKLPVLFGHPQSIGHGLNLQEVGNHVCWHTLTWDYELYDQFIRRVLRQGNKNAHVFVHHFVMRKTVDEAVLAALRAKARGQRALFDALVAMGRGG